MVRKTLQTSQTDHLSLQPMPVLIYAQLVRTKSANQPFSFFIQITHLSARFRCQPCNDKLVRLSLQTTISILYLVRTHLQTRIKILHLVRTSLQTSYFHFILILHLVRKNLQTRDLHSISILYCIISPERSEGEIVIISEPAKTTAASSCCSNAATAV